MTMKRGRPPVPGVSITLRLNDQTAKILDTGIDLLATRDGKSPNRSSWLRELIQFVSESELRDSMTAELLSERWPDAWFLEPTPHQTTVRFEDDQLIWLRQFGCYVQSLDWTREVGRKEVVLILIAAHGPVLNRVLGAAVNPQALT